MRNLPDVEPGEAGFLLSETTGERKDVDEAMVRRWVEEARAERLDRVLTFVSVARPAIAQFLDRLGFHRMPWRDRSTIDGGELQAYGLGLAPVVVRRAESAELDRAGALTLAGYLADGFVDPSAWYARHLTDAADRAATADLLVAVDPAGDVVGTVTFCRPGSPYAEISVPGEAEFRMLAVSPAARGAGVGAALVHACLDLAGAAGDHRVVLSTTAHMRAAARIYRRLGFVADPARNWSPLPGVDLLAYQRDVQLVRPLV